jgi:hypothetical protein
MALKRMDNIGIVFDDLGETTDFFLELGLELEGRATIEGEWAGRVTGLAGQRVEIATPHLVSCQKRSSLFHDLCRAVSSSSGERRRGSPFTEASDPGGSRNGSTGMRS